MNSPEFLLYRLNLVDRENLFAKPIRDDDDLIRVVREASEQRCDFVQQSKKSRWKWSIRDISTGKTEEGRRYILATFSYETLSRSGKIVGPRGITIGTSEMNPPLAITSQLIVDLNRHVVAIEDVASIMQHRTTWKESLQTLLSQASNWQGYTSRISLTPIPPRQVVEANLRRFNLITRLRATLRIPNPDLSPIFESLYEELQQGGVRELTEDMRSERGLNLDEGGLPRATLEMALSGYRKGHIRIDGFRHDGTRDEFVIADDVARLEGLRGFVSGVATGSSSKEGQRVAGIILAKMDEMLPPQSNRKA